MNDKTQKKSVEIIEVGPRDGLQNEKTIISTDDKLNFILKLLNAGLKSLEVTSFVRPDRIPQMADAHDLYTKLINNLNCPLENLDLYCLVPNLRGYENSQSAGVKNIALFSATSEEFNLKNINATIDESIKRFSPVFDKIKTDQVKLRGYISTVFGCPYEGKVNNSMKDQLFRLIELFLNQNANDVSLGDTIGVATPELVEQLGTEIKSRFGTEKIAMHFHDTKGRAIANIWTSYQLGFKRFDSSAGGLGGCPYAKGASGNVATEDVIDLFESSGVHTGIDINAIFKASSEILTKINRQSQSKIHQYISKNNG